MMGDGGECGRDGGDGVGDRWDGGGEGMRGMDGE